MRKLTREVMLLVVFMVALAIMPAFAKVVSPTDPRAALVYYHGDYGIESIWGDGSHHQTIISGYYAAMPDISPDGRYLAFCTYPWDTGTAMLKVYDVKNKKTFTIATGDMINDPSWSPDSRSLVYSDGGKLFTVNVSNIRRPKAPVRLTDSEWHIIETNPDWGSNGLIAYELMDDDGWGILYQGIAGFNLATKETSALVIGGSPKEGASWIIQPSFSPDGSKLAFTIIGEWDASVYIKDIDEPGIGDYLIDGWAEAWHPSGKSLFVNRSDNFYYGIYRVDLAGDSSDCITKGWAYGSSATWNPSFKIR